MISFSCSFGKKSCQIIGFWHTHLGIIGFTTGNDAISVKKIYKIFIILKGWILNLVNVLTEYLFEF